MTVMDTACKSLYGLFSVLCIPIILKPPCLSMLPNLEKAKKYSHITYFLNLTERGKPGRLQIIQEMIVE